MYFANESVLLIYLTLKVLTYAFRKKHDFSVMEVLINWQKSYSFKICMKLKFEVLSRSHMFSIFGSSELYDTLVCDTDPVVLTNTSDFFGNLLKLNGD